MNALPPDALVWDARDIRTVIRMLWMASDIYRDPVVKGPAPETAEEVRLLRRWEVLATHLDKLRHDLEGLQRQQVQPRIRLTTEDA